MGGKKSKHQQLEQPPPPGKVDLDGTPEASLEKLPEDPPQEYTKCIKFNIFLDKIYNFYIF